MSDSILVCGQWPLPLRPGTGGFYEYLQTASSKNASCFLELVKDLPSGLSVSEHFGGCGLFSTIIQQVLHPRTHTIYDLDSDCVAQLESVFGSVASVAQGDAKETMGARAQLVVLDFAYATIRNHDEWPWARVTAAEPGYIIWSDTACRRIGLHRAAYSKIFGTPIHTHEDYVNAYSQWMWKRYGYSIVKEAHHVYSYMRAERTPPVEIKFTKVTR